MSSSRPDLLIRDESAHAKWIRTQREKENEQLSRLVLRVAALDTGSRELFLKQLAAEDSDLAAQVAQRLENSRIELSFLASPAGRLLDHLDDSPYAPEPERPQELPSGTRLGERYRILHLLGSGGMADVYRADDLELGEKVALKVLDASNSLADDDRQLSLFEEVRMARKISHPNICRVHDIGRFENLCYLSMEYIDGENLASLSKRVGRLPPAKAKEIGLDLCEGLSAAHALQILHRDLKPSNVMLDGRGRAIITDFGLAGWVGARDPRGSPAYYAPELWDGEAASLTSDLYALGLVLYELFCGHFPFHKTSVAELRRQHREVAPIPPHHWVEGLAPELEILLMDCLKKDPRHRPASARDVADQLLGLGPRQRGSLAEASKPIVLLKTLLACEVSTKGGSLPESYREPIDNLVEHLGKLHQGQHIAAASGWWLLFERPIRAVAFALDFQAVIDDDPVFSELSAAAKVAIHVDEVQVGPSRVHDRQILEFKEITLSPVRSLLALTMDHQILLTRSAFDLAVRNVLIGRRNEVVAWLAHGSYAFAKDGETRELFEVGIQNRSRCQAPIDSTIAWRIDENQTILGWRAAPGVEVPGRPHWRVIERFGHGPKNDVCRCVHQKTGERRIFKFCYDAESLRALKREITLFRLLQQELGERDDIVRILDWNFDEAPYFIESEYTAGGNLIEWAEQQGGIRQVPLTVRLDIAIQISEALAAAHSVGILHRNIKPENILITNSTLSVHAKHLILFAIRAILDLPETSITQNYEEAKVR